MSVLTRGQRAIKCQNISKRFGTVLANDNIDLTVHYGEILALLGENGSGKTTLMNMLSGIYHPDGGEIYLNDGRVHINSPQDAIDLGIGMIHQHFKLVDVMTAYENIILGAKNKKRMKAAEQKKEVEALSEKYGLEVNLNKKIYDMSVSEKQTVEVLKVLYRGADILVLDEPTAVLTPQEIEKLFAILRRMRDDCCAVIIITHKLNEVMAISDRVTVLRKGKSVAEVVTAEVDERKLTELMVGRPVSLSIRRPEIAAEKKHPVMRVQNLTVNSSDGTRGLVDASFEAFSGEILGIAGVAGSGQKELSEALVGLIPVQEGHIYYEENDLVGLDTSEIYAKGVSLAFVPEDRLGMGLVGSMGMTGNMLLKTYRNNKGPFVDRAPAQKLALDLKQRLDIQTPAIETPVRMLSGGNVQKVLLGREIESAPKVLITAYPVRGLDINSSYTIYDLLNEQKEKECAVIFVGEDLDVLLELCDRILVLCQGKITGIVDAKTANKEQIGLMMVGIQEAAV